jgi:hypothetical protein
MFVPLLDPLNLGFILEVVCLSTTRTLPSTRPHVCPPLLPAPLGSVHERIKRIRDKRVRHLHTPIFTHIYSHISTPPSFSRASSPLFVALQGPQGSGKPSLTGRVKGMLAEVGEVHPSYRVATLSIDDLYLPHA